MSRPAVKTSLTVLAALLLAGCVTSQPTAMPPPAPAPSEPTVAPPPPAPMVRANPIYKVGDPYQVSGTWYYPQEQPDYDQTGVASWYGADFHGRLTANGEVYDRTRVTAAHPTLPMPVNVRVTNLENGRSLVVRVNDRGPFARGRIIDLSEHAADLLGYRATGTARVRVTFLGRADLYGPGLASPSQETPPEIASAVPAAPVTRIEASSLPPVAGTRVAAEAKVASLPTPVEQVILPALPQIADGQVTEMPVPAATALYVQVGAFTSALNAATVAGRLASVGAQVHQGMKDGRALFRVRIGPFQNVADADATLMQVQAFGLNDVQIVVEPAMS